MLFLKIIAKAREELQSQGGTDCDLYVCEGACLHAFVFVVSM